MALTLSLPLLHLKIDAPALDAMTAHRQTAADASEAGGALLGRVLASGDVVVDLVTEPLPSDVRSRAAFHRSRAHQISIDAAHERSGGVVGWLGEWHTHPEPDPTPSAVDLDDWHRRAHEDVYEGERLFFVIVGQERTRAWSCDRRGNVIPLA